MIWIEEVREPTLGELMKGMSKAMSDFMVTTGFAQQMAEGRWEESRPTCSVCGEHITDEDALYLDGEWICNDCVRYNTKSVDEYMYNQELAERSERYDLY